MFRKKRIKASVELSPQVGENVFRFFFSPINKLKVAFSTPHVFQSYNKAMGGVDQIVKRGGGSCLLDGF